MVGIFILHPSFRARNQSGFSSIVGDSGDSCYFCTWGRFDVEYKNYEPGTGME
jgi:hypothetical protein